ncbi:hypothetical protein DOY81_012316 [Sarcophaga bullata]|nr:hypothetical protein DOY81_012316 [Sarcophaga bullata]
MSTYTTAGNRLQSVKNRICEHNILTPLQLHDYTAIFAAVAN